MNDGEMRSRRTTYLATGTITNAPCTSCGKDTMHKNGRCLDCERADPQVVEPRRGAIANRVPVKS